MAKLLIQLSVGGVDVSKFDIDFPDADATAILSAFRMKDETDQQVMDGLAAKWVDELERRGNAAAEARLINEAVAEVQKNFAAKNTLRTSVKVAEALVSKEVRDRKEVEGIASIVINPELPKKVIPGKVEVEVSPKESNHKK